MSTPSAIIAICDNCGEMMHRVLKGRISGRREIVFEGVVKCQRCGRVHTVVKKEPRPIKIPLILSWMEESQMKEIEVELQTTVSVGDIMELDGGRIEITAIESGGKRVEELEASGIGTLWAKKADKSRIKVTISRGERSRAKEIIVNPEKEFSVGDEIWLDGERCVIERIKINQRIVYRGSARAADVKRIYARASASRRSFRPASEKVGAGRRAYKEGRKPRHRQ